MLSSTPTSPRQRYPCPCFCFPISILTPLFPLVDALVLACLSLPRYLAHPESRLTTASYKNAMNFQYVQLHFLLAPTCSPCKATPTPSAAATPSGPKNSMKHTTPGLTFSKQGPGRGITITTATPHRAHRSTLRARINTSQRSTMILPSLQGHPCSVCHHSMHTCSSPNPHSRKTTRRPCPLFSSCTTENLHEAGSNGSSVIATRHRSSNRAAHRLRHRDQRAGTARRCRRCHR